MRKKVMECGKLLYLYILIIVFYQNVKSKIVISPTNTKAIEFIKSLKDKKAQIQKHFAQSGKLSSLKVDFGNNGKKNDSPNT
ncbi:hypothetical protein [Ferruginibacter sp. HRS2-29]|uniref:hypothetical protein n=1 Tax=Ferruginibacter sp. HRS2-29 TaxID=2487334 RepID=UPI0020CCAB25|nr:hypothetical protein [Ferruginibacter sp. HRS2-29]